MFGLRWTTRMTRAVATIWTAHEALKRGWSSNLCSPWAPLLWEVLRVLRAATSYVQVSRKVLQSTRHKCWNRDRIYIQLTFSFDSHMMTANGRGYTCYTSPRQSAFRWTCRLQYASILHSRNLPAVSNCYKSGQIPTLGPWKALRLNRALSPGTCKAWAVCWRKEYSTSTGKYTHLECWLWESRRKSDWNSVAIFMFWEDIGTSSIPTFCSPYLAMKKA